MKIRKNRVFVAVSLLLIIALWLSGFGLKEIIEFIKGMVEYMSGSKLFQF